MNKLLRTLAIILSTFCCLEMWGEEVSVNIDFSKTYINKEDNGLSINHIDIDDNISVTFYKNTNNNGPKYYTDGTSIRCYGGNSFTISSLSGNISEVTFTYGSSDGANKITADCGIFKTPTWKGEAQQITFTIEGTTGNRRIKGISVKYNDLHKIHTTTSFDKSDQTNYTIELNKHFISPKAISTSENGETFTPTYTSSNTDVATVNSITGEVNIIGLGTTIIKAEFVGDEEYIPSSAQYTLTVVEYVALVAKHGEKYYALNSNDLSSIAVPIINIKVVVNTDADYSSLMWNITEQNNNYQIKNPQNKYLAPSTTRLTLQDEVFEWEYNDKYHWYTKEGNTTRAIYHSFNNGGFVNYSVSMINDTYSDVTCSYPFTNGYTRTMSLKDGEAYKWGTICLPNAVNAGDFAGATFYTIVGKEIADDMVTALVLKEEEKLEAGMPYIFKATANIVAAYSGESVSEPVNKNGLYGVLSGTVTINGNEGYYGVANNKVNPLGAGATIPANRAYIRMNEVPEYTENTAEAKVIRFDMNEATNIISTTMDDEEVYFNLKGQRVIEPKNGIYIKNGKKVLIK